MTAIPSRGGRLSDLRLRALSAFVLGVVALGSLWLGGLWFETLWLVAALAVHWEWQRMVGGPNGRARLVLGALALVVATALAANLLSEALLAALAVVVAASLGMAVLAGPGRRLWGAGAIPYAATLSVSAVVLRLSILDGLEAIAWLFAVVWGTDILAYFGGRAIGGPKLWPRVSPGKTWSGFLTGVIGGAACGWIVATALVRGQSIGWTVFGLGLAAAALAQAGDLAESAIKRRFGVKDSSQLIPGHGGVMDRLDGFIVASAFAAAVGALHLGLVQAGHGLFAW